MIDYLTERLHFLGVYQQVITHALCRGTTTEVFKSRVEGKRVRHTLYMQFLYNQFSCSQVAAKGSSKGTYIGRSIILQLQRRADGIKR